MIELPALTIESVFGCVPACATDNISILSGLVGRARGHAAEDGLDGQGGQFDHGGLKA